MSTTRPSTFASHVAGSTIEDIRSIDMRIGEQSFPIHVTHNNLRALIQKLLDTVDEFDKLMLGYDINTFEHCGSLLEPVLTSMHVPFERYVIGTTEENKTFQNLDDALGAFLTAGVSRKSIVMPVGGGIVSNLFGLAASLLFRGIRLVEMPTTFLNAHDAVTSQKTAVNHSGYKNIVGTFHIPTMVLCDTFFYQTLGESEIKSGLGELTKNAALFGGEHYELIEKTTLAHGPELSGEELVEATFLGIKAKDALLCDDPREKHLALLFEYGHTIGHALELTEGINTSHGEGVTIGMLGASYISEKMGLMSSAERERHDAMVTALQPAMFIENPDCMEEVLDKIHHDNKRGYLPERVGFVPMILAKKCGEIHKPNDMYLEYVPDDLVEEAVMMILEKFMTPETARDAAARRASIGSVVSPQVSAGSSRRSRL